MYDPTENLIRAFDVRIGDWILPEGFYVGKIEGLGGDEMGPAIWRFHETEPTLIGGYLEYPYAALVEVDRGTGN